jgi:hypothetical protein
MVLPTCRGKARPTMLNSAALEQRHDAIPGFLHGAANLLAGLLDLLR